MKLGVETNISHEEFKRHKLFSIDWEEQIKGNMIKVISEKIGEVYKDEIEDSEIENWTPYHTFKFILYTFSKKELKERNKILNSLLTQIIEEFVETPSERIKLQRKINEIFYNCFFKM